MTLTQREREAAERFDAMVRDVLSGKIMATVGDSIRLAQAVTALKSGSQLARVEAYSVCAKLICGGCNAGAQVYENAERDYHVQADGVRDICLASPIRAKLAEEKAQT